MEITIYKIIQLHGLVNLKMKGEDMKAMLESLIEQALSNKNVMATFKKKLERDHDNKKKMYEKLKNWPRYMNYILSQKILHAAKIQNANMMDYVYNMQHEITEEIEG